MSKTINERKRELWEFVWARDALTHTKEMLHLLSSAIHAMERAHIERDIIKKASELQRGLTLQLENPLRAKVEEKERGLLK